MKILKISILKKDCLMKKLNILMKRLMKWKEFQRERKKKKKCLSLKKMFMKNKFSKQN